MNGSRVSCNSSKPTIFNLKGKVCMDKSDDFVIRSEKIPNSKGIYIAQPIGSRMRVIDKKRAHIMPSVNNAYIKVGKAINLRQRFANYYHDNDGDVEFTPIIICDEYSDQQLKDFESLLKRKFESFSFRNPKTNRKLEWLEGISFEDVREMILSTHKEFEKSC